MGCRHSKCKTIRSQTEGSFNIGLAILVHRNIAGAARGVGMHFALGSEIRTINGWVS